MDKRELTVRLARRAKVSKALAADRLDSVAAEILARLRRGQPVALPGLGTLLPGKRVRFKPEGK